MRDDRNWCAMIRGEEGGSVFAKATPRQVVSKSPPNPPRRSAGLPHRRLTAVRPAGSHIRGWLIALTAPQAARPFGGRRALSLPKRPTWLSPTFPGGANLEAPSEWLKYSRAYRRRGNKFHLACCQMKHFRRACPQRMYWWRCCFVSARAHWGVTFSPRCEARVYGAIPMATQG